ncbi:MAG TPA: hypothetical protein VFF54_09275 [Thermodesulfobacteriota bacterium]|nr:hypothetical protein [Thermodesulfobacteriota bacterium]
MKTFYTLAIAALAVIGLALFATPASAVHKNPDNQLACGSCHTMHNSQGGGANTLGGSPSIVLLRGIVAGREQIHNFCLQCHASNGAQGGSTHKPHEETAPKVYIDGQQGAGNSAVAGTLDSFLVIGAGGDFSGDLSGSSVAGWTDGSTNFLGQAHSLGTTALTPPGGDNVVATFSCTSCHDPHGAYTSTTSVANIYRNLKLQPDITGGEPSVTLNANVKSYRGMGGYTVGGGTGDDSWAPSNGALDTGVWAIADDAGVAWDGSDPCVDGVTGKVNCYGVSAGAATDGISYWCATCHDNWHEDVVAGDANRSGNDWKRHPVENLLDDGSTTSGAGITIINTTTYGTNAVAADGFRLPVAKTGAAGYEYYLSGDPTTSKVFCLSCHFAHGGPYNDNLRWDYTSGVPTPGGQTGNSLDSTTGCQQCHNR